jgi:hypothetical protein
LRSLPESIELTACEGEAREYRIAVLRRGALTCQVVAVIFTAVAFWLLAVN